jgi:nucleotide-binding universal stress UspA family protein
MLKKDGDAMRFRHVLCAVDFSPPSRAALRTAAALARVSHDRLTVLFVNDPLLSAAGAAAHDARASSRQSHAALERFIVGALPATASRPRRLHALVTVGTAADEILRSARRHRADLIVMGTRGMGRMKRLLLGTTAEGVLRRTRIPVLAVPAP